MDRDRVEQPQVVVGVEIAADDGWIRAGVEVVHDRAELLDSVGDVDARIQVNVVHQDRPAGVSTATPSAMRCRLRKLRSNRFKGRTCGSSSGSRARMARPMVR